MKDRQIQQGAPPGRILLISPSLHCVSMTVIVFMRSSFGFVYLRPRSFFFAISWAFLLFTFYVLYERKFEYGLLCIFGMAAIGLYWAHLLTAFVRELYRKGKHDHDSGTPHTIRILRRISRSPTALFDKNWRIWVEPLMVLTAGLMLRYVFRERYLSSWLLFVAPCFSLKEALNFWFQIRKEKTLGDSRSDAEEMFDSTPNKVDPDAPRAVGKEKVKRARTPGQSAEEEIREKRYAEILRLLPPYTLETAEENYRKLIKQCHPDSSEPSPENNEQAAFLNEAVEFFRSTLA